MAGGNITDVPTHMPHASVMYHDTVHIVFLVATLNGLDILVVYIHNAFKEAPIQEKIFFYVGDKWKADKDIIFVVIRELYVFKSSALQFRNHLVENLGNKLGFKCYIANPDLCYKASI